ncbi:MAG: hypothetical protein IJ268_06910 [Proteobacteria bacterium]|nr:hypothetical protein [Pseudomonadota bacterium]
MANTFILFWNPDISSFSAARFRALRHWWKDSMNWSVWAHDLAHDGDRFFLVKCGTRPNGIVMSGRFCSEPYKGVDWSGKGRDVFYMDLDMEFIGDPQDCMLSSDILARNIPNFDWYGGHSGRLLDEEDANRLELLWQAFISKYVLDCNEGDNDEDDIEEFEEDEDVDEDEVGEDDDANEAIEAPETLDDTDEDEDDNDNEDVYDEDADADEEGETVYDEGADADEEGETVYDEGADVEEDADADEEGETVEEDEDNEDADDGDITRAAVCSRKQYSLWLQEEWRERVDEYLRKKHGEACEICGFEYSAIFAGEAHKSNAYKYLGTGECEDLETVESEYHCMCNNCNQLVSDIDDFEKYQSLAKEYAQKVHLSNMLVNHIKSLQALLSGAKTTRPDLQLNKLLEKLSSKSTVIQHGIDKYQEIMKLLNIKKKKS